MIGIGLDSTLPTAAALPSAPSTALSSVLRSAAGGAGADTAPFADHLAARAAAEELVATTFIAPILAQLRESSLVEDGPFAPTTVEDRFGPLLDQHISDRIVKSTRLPLVDEIERRLTGATTP